MTATADTAARANRDGDPCPPWCVTDHGKYGFHAAEDIVADAPDLYRNHVRAVKFPADRRSQIQVASAGVVYVGHDNAGELADLIEGLAEATPEQHRQLASAIRQAAEITEAASE